MSSERKNKTVAIINCSQVVTLAGPARPRVGPEMRELAILAHGGLFARDGLIERVGTTAEVESVIDRDTEVIDAGGRVVLPGFVDAHTHPVFAGTRVDEFEERSRGATYEEIAARGGGIQSTVNRTRAASVDDLVAAGRRYAEWFLRGGTTTIEAKSGYGLSLEDELKILRAIKRLNSETPLRYVPTFLGAPSVPQENRAQRAEYISRIVDAMLPQVARQRS